MIKYGLISGTDARTLENTVDLICGNNVPHLLNITEVGVYSGQTMNGLREYIKSIGWEGYFTGVDNNKDGEKIRFEYDRLIIGNSNEVYNQIPDESQHLTIIDALHTKLAVISDFFAFAPKVKKGSYICFHDTGKHINPLHGWQGIGDRNDPDFCLGGVRKALADMMMFTQIVSSNSDFTENKIWVGNSYLGWELIFDEADPNDEAGGFCIFKKLY